MAPPSRPSDFDVACDAVMDGDLHLLRKMASKVDLREAKDDHGRTALHLAAVQGHLDICRFLVEELGLDVNSTSAGGGSPVHFAAVGGNAGVLRYLIDRGGDPGMPNLKGYTPLHNAADQGNYEAVRLLLSKDVDVDPLNHYATPLHLATAKDRVQVVKILLEHGADPKRVLNHVYTPLMMACCGHSLNCMKLLVEAGADVNFRSPCGPTILMEAVDDGLTDMVKFLVEAGADPNIADEEGKIPIMCAAAHGKRELVEILFPRTNPIPSVLDWSVDGIIRAMKYPRFNVQDSVSPEQHVADMKSRGKEAFAKGEYIGAIYFYDLAADENPNDATLFANLSLCWLRLGEGKHALEYARRCKMINPHWSKAWYREGAALALLKNYEGAVDAFMQALKLDPASEEIKKALREAMEALKRAVLTELQNT